MNRRTFNATAIAAAVSPLPRQLSAAAVSKASTGYQFAAINDGLLTVKHSGMARAGTAVDDDTLFQVASCSKTVTALAVLALVRDGHVDLDEPVNRYLRRWHLTGARGAKASIAELMSHTAGTTVHGFEGYEPDEDLPDLTEILGGHGPANSGPIQARRRLFRQFRYSGGGTMVLQALIEDVTGMDFAAYTRDAVLKPVGASGATFAIIPDAPFAHGSFENGKALNGGFRRHPESAAAGLWATASDLARIFHAVLRALDGVRHALIPIALAERMVTPVSSGAGLGVFVSPGPMISHQGRNFGFDAIVVADLRTGRVRAAVTNQNGALDTYARQLLPQ
ncbi:serine hydrolase domain-containing protein [uncultured Tateyamaria sp.]|uniref:serine hydrolase domain-containing protein n=1 Tax=uncultured Tateyamaria sp. TaxID=455651 RepID=UPI0026278654|nr:serine hydrolase domain-containing protein [uncultured Tateyamaria sp.]